MKQLVDIRDVMRLSPETVTRVTTERTVLHRPRPVRVAPEPVPVERRNVDPLIMEAALRLTNGDVSRINLRDDGSIVITNRPRAGIDKKAPR
jgi:hypothetical protein